ncbi:exonuclease domain-containing protein [Marinoscillum sp.]|uniref:3'-5' exonuclease n=1 Tax=Marinoscillum sp. TaxID=2024838 RepID=UPI003BAA7887
MNKHLLFLDTETSGIPDSLNAPVRELENWPFVLQLAWLVYTADGELVKQENHFIFEEEIYIESSSFKIHGITRESLKARGKDRRSVMKLLASDLRHYKPLIVGHFVEFDSKMVQVAFIRSGLKNIVPKYQHFCTMRATSEYTRFPNQSYPKLEELYQSLFGEQLTDTHNASSDAQATARCFFELLRKDELTTHRIRSQKLFFRIEQPKPKAGCGLPVLVFILIGLITLWL